MKVLPDERELLRAEIAAALDRLPPGEARDGYRELLAGVERGEVGDEHLAPLARLVELGLESGRIRAVHGPHAEMAATRLFHRTPRGGELAETLRAANAALEALAGSQLRQLAFSLRGPGAYALTLQTDRCDATLLIDRNGIRVQSLEVGG